MANPLDAWQQIPTSVLDLGQRTADAESWATQQRAKIAETWANTQKQAISTMASTWQQGTDAIDHFADGFASTPQPQQGPMGYNDMVGADTSPQGPLNSYPSGISSPIDQARADQANPNPIAGYNDMAGAPSGLRTPGLPEQALNTVMKVQDRARQAVNLAAMPDLANPDETSPRKAARYYTQHTDPNASMYDRIGQMLDYADSVGDKQFANAVRQNPNAAWLQPAYNLATNPLTYAGVTKPMMVGGGIGAGIGAGVSAAGGGSPSDIATGAIAGYGTGQVIGGLGEGAYHLGKKVAPAIGRVADAAAPQLGRLAADESGMVTVGGSKSEDSTRFFHGTTEPLPNGFDPFRQSRDGVHGAGLGPGTYFSPNPHDAEYFSGIGEGANVRPVNIPNSMNMFRLGDKVDPDVAQRVARTLDVTLSESLLNGEANNHALYTEMVRRTQNLPDTRGRPGEAKALINKALSREGFDGILDNVAASRDGMDKGQALIFGSSLDKVTNAISGTRFGSSPTIGGALVGGYAGSQQGDTPEERARNAALGAVSGGIGGHLLGRWGEGKPVDVGLSIKPEVPTGTLPQMAKETLKDAGGTAAQQAQLRPREAGDAANIMLSKFEPSVRSLLDTAATTMNDFAGQRRGVITDKQALANATETARLGLGLSVQDFLKTKAGTAFNQEQAIALGQTLNKTGEDFDALAAQLRVAAAAGTVTDAQKANLASKALEFAALAAVRSGVTAEAGRTLRSFRQALDGSGASREFAINTAFKAIGTDPAKFTDWLTAWQTTPVNDFTNRYKLLQSLYDPKIKDYANEWLYNAILSNPSTHIANSVSNTVNALLGPVERVGAASVDAPLSALQGRPRGRFFGEAKANLYGLIQGVPEGGRAAVFALTHGFTEATAAAAKGEIPRREAFRGPAGVAINLPSRMLTAADAFMQPIMQRGALNAEIFRQAASEGLSGPALKTRIADLTAHVPDDLMERAGKMAEYQLYRQEPKKFAKGLNTIRGLDIYGVEPLRLVLPFVQVPVNATKYGLERTPLGFLNQDLWKNLAKKDPAAADNIARAGMGSIVAATIASQVANGNIDIAGAAPTDPAKRDAFYRQGKLPFSFKIGGKWISFQRWEPFNHSFTQVAAAVDAIRDAKAGASTSELAMRAGLTIGQNIESQSFLTGINNFLNAATDPDRYGAQFAAQLETSMVPASSFMRATANALDPRQRSPQGVAENIQSVVPGLSRNVPSRLNNYGEEQAQPGNPFLPYKWQDANDSPLEAELARLKVEPGSTGKTLRGIDLTRQENADHQRLAGQQVKQLLTQLVADPRYRQLNDAQKAKALELTITRAKDAAAKQHLTQMVQQQGQAAILQRIQQKKLSSLGRAS